MHANHNWFITTWNSIAYAADNIRHKDGPYSHLAHFSTEQTLLIMLEWSDKRALLRTATEASTLIQSYF